VVNATVRIDDAVVGTRVDGVKEVTETMPPRLGGVNMVPALSVDVEIETPAAEPQEPEDEICMGPPIVTPAIVTVKEPAVTAAVVVIVTEFCVVAPMLAAKPVEATTGVVGVPVMYELG